MFAGLYINLDRSTARRARLESELSALGLAPLYRRLVATDGATCPPLPAITAGEVGCYHSHCSALTIAAESDRPTHVLEDDAKLSRIVPAVIAAANGLLQQADIVFLDLQMPDELALWHMYRNRARIRPTQLTVLDLTGSAFTATTSYVVPPRGARKIRDICAAEFERAPRAIDLIVRDLARDGKLRACALVPFATTLHLGDAQDSTIGNRSEDDDYRLAMNLVRYSFFVDADLAGHARPFIDLLRQRIAHAPGREINRRIRAALDFLS